MPTPRMNRSAAWWAGVSRPLMRFMVCAVASGTPAARESSRTMSAAPGWIRLMSGFRLPARTDGHRRDIPDVFAVFPDGAVGGEVTRAGDVQDRHAGP